MKVGRHEAVSAGAVIRFMKRFESAYTGIGRARAILCAAAAHHRLLWVHPFLDGNGRVTRLMSHAMLAESLDSGSLWSIARGLARNVSAYKGHLANCDLRRRNDLDGERRHRASSPRGALMTAGRVRLSVAEARELGEAALRGIGYADEEARIIADHVIDAALCGYEYSGLAKILNIPESRHFRQPRRPMGVLRETDVSIAFDGGNNVGMLALYHAAQAAIDKAGAHGIALVSVNDAWMSGRSAYYVEMIAKAGLVAIHTVGSSRLVAPPGGTRPALGTNPIAIAVPSSRGPIVLDMGTSAFMATEVLLRERLGELLPEGVAIGPDGEPTRDPALARRGALLPFGGYKGFGLALMMQALGLLAGAG